MTGTAGPVLMSPPAGNWIMFRAGVVRWAKLTGAKPFKQYGQLRTAWEKDVAAQGWDRVPTVGIYDKGGVK